MARTLRPAFSNQALGCLALKFNIVSELEDTSSSGTSQQLHSGV
eukprot:CAMPEP_0197646346 /NCGR_PEP_ID=MMETSP1338-20131121/22955_1 /TAXON_ID=43686 ORGANISM="Pelagodinium beii, Strain RCC1491" /NCGR_SAMPLE_ID=MMETSP1338 /ASSEMBLY_ACC=CAM_ASM_000754 /LENGTH=43 /DNA_ID= /DNA_START= /DNA_END= /DNA_ORIENTATION=